MASASDFASRMVAALALSEPELDTSIGSPTRKMIDAFAEVAAEVSIDAHLLDYQFDIDSKVGADLDDFCLTFGITRFSAQRAVGTVTFSRPTPATEDTLIPANTQVVTGTSPQVAFVTIVPAYLTKASTSVDVPIQAVVGGQSGNLVAGSLTLLASPVNGISSVVANHEATSGGTNTEPDADLIARWKKTVFRSLAGTEDMFLGTALEAPSVATADGQAPSQAIVLGSSRRWREQVQIAADGTALSTIPASNVKAVYADSSVFGTDIDSGSILTPGVHYTFDSTVIPPKVTGLAGALTVGGLYDLDFEYSSTASRNDPMNGVTNRVDVWVNGELPVTASETLYFRSTKTFNDIGGDPMNRAQFARLDTADAAPTAGNIFVRLAFGPVLTFPDTLVINQVTYRKGTDYNVVFDKTAFGLGPTSRYGLEWLSTNVPTENTAISLSGTNAYTYNRVPRDVEDRIRRWRLVTTDVRAHAARRINLVLNLAVMFDVSYDSAQVQASMTTAISDFLTVRGFDTRIQVSDLLQVAHNVTGVDNVRFLTSAEPLTGGHYAIERVSSTGTRISYVTSGSPARAADLTLGDNEIPVLYGLNVSLRAANTFGVS